MNDFLIYCGLLKRKASWEVYFQCNQDLIQDLLTCPEKLQFITGCIYSDTNNREIFQMKSFFFYYWSLWEFDVKQQQQRKQKRKTEKKNRKQWLNLGCSSWSVLRNTKMIVWNIQNVIRTLQAVHFILLKGWIFLKGSFREGLFFLTIRIVWNS